MSDRVNGTSLDQVWMVTTAALADDDVQEAFVAWVAKHTPSNEPVLAFRVDHECPTGVALRDAIRQWEEKIDARG